MSGATDMSTPVTRGELRAELAQFEIRFDQKLEHWGGALLARIESGEQRMLKRMFEHMDSSEQRMLARIESGEQRMLKRMFEHMDSSEQRMLTDLSRHANAIQEAMSAQISVIDEKYTDLPARVSWLEAKGSEPRRR
jgi:exonuclease VII large subunit